MDNRRRGIEKKMMGYRHIPDMECDRCGKLTTCWIQPEVRWTLYHKDPNEGKYAKGEFYWCTPCEKLGCNDVRDKVSTGRDAMIKAKTELQNSQEPECAEINRILNEIGDHSMYASTRDKLILQIGNLLIRKKTMKGK